MAPDVRLVTAATLPVPDDECERIERALARRGLRAEVAVWSDPRVDWSAAPLTVIRTTWDYHRRRDAFLAWAARACAETSLWNPAPLLRWNSHKSYLLDLERAGVPVIPTRLLAAGSRVALDDALAERGWRRAVAKPAVSIGGHGAARVAPGDAVSQRHLDTLLREGDVVLQPYAERIESEGEISIVLLDGRPAHARCKRPAPGDFRIHEHLGGRTHAIEMSEEARDAALRVLATLSEPTLYARVDLVRLEGELRLMELELIEPSLYLESDAELDAAARAIAERL